MGPSGPILTLVTTKRIAHCPHGSDLTARGCAQGAAGQAGAPPPPPALVAPAGPEDGLADWLTHGAWG